MTAIRQAPARSAIHPATAARSVLFVLPAVNLLFVWFTFFSSDAPEKNTLIHAGKFFGLHVALAMIFQLFLIARIPWLDRRLGMDRLTTLHRWTGFTIFWALLLHVGFIISGYAQLDGNTIPAQTLSLAGSFPVLLGMVAFLFLTVIAISSARYARRRLSYETWHALHVLLYMVIILALIHQLFEITTFTASSLSRAYWFLLWALALGSLVAFRVVLPVIRNSRHRFRVAAVVPEADDVVSVHVTGRNLDRLPARAGQFMLWRFPGHNEWWQANPWSLSAAPDGTSLRLTAKAVGSTSAGLRGLPVGNRVFAEGPYGALTSLARTKQSSLLVAGGIGVTPIRSLLEELTGPITVLYRVRDESGAVLLNELRELAEARGAQLHLLTGRTSSGNPLAPDHLQSLVPDITERDVYICGPDPMTVTVLKSLRALRVPKKQVHAERFRLAG